LVSLIPRHRAFCRRMHEPCRVAQSLLTPGTIMLENLRHVSIDAQINGAPIRFKWPRGRRNENIRVRELLVGRLLTPLFRER
jgi:hypothetical protein